MNIPQINTPQIPTNYKMNGNKSIRCYSSSIIRRYSWIILFVGISGLFQIPVVSAQGPNSPISDLFDKKYAPPLTRLGEVAGSGFGIAEKLANWIIAVFWIVVVGFVVWAAFNFLTANGEENKIDIAKQKVKYALIAAVIALLATGIKPITMSLLRGETGGGGTGPGPEIGETSLKLNGKDCLDLFADEIELNGNPMASLNLYDSTAERKRQQAPDEPIYVTISSTASDSQDKTYLYEEATNASVNICNPMNPDASCTGGSYTLTVKIDYTIGGSNSLECKVRLSI